MVSRTTALLAILLCLAGSTCARSQPGEPLRERPGVSLGIPYAQPSLPARLSSGPTDIWSTEPLRVASRPPALPSSFAPQSSDPTPPVRSVPGQWELRPFPVPPVTAQEVVPPGEPVVPPGLEEMPPPNQVPREPGVLWSTTSPPPPPPWPTVVRLGWWHSSFTGSPTKVGEYQDLQSFLFWDIDRIASDGIRTLDLTVTGLDREATDVDLRYIGPAISADIEYDRYLRRLDRDPLDAFVDFDKQPPDPLPPAPANFRDMKEDRTVGQDFAIRVQELDTEFEGSLTKNIDWRINVWAMRKSGQRQAMALGHCFTAPNATDTNGVPVTGVACHILSQSQRIDWLTTELEPAVEGRFGPVSIEYSRTMRTLSTGDQVVTRPYDNFGFNGDFPYAVVPENFTQIDRLKLGVRFPGRRDFYSRFFIGSTENRYRDTLRRFRGYDVRLTDRSRRGLSLTAYTDGYIQKGTLPATLLPQETAASIRAPLGYDQIRLGFRGRWRPFIGERSWRGRLLLSGGYQYGELRRSNAVFVEQVLTANQSLTTTNIAHLRASWRWSPTFDSFVGYRVGVITHPLYGVPVRNTTTNTSLPTEQHVIDFGGTWMPTERFLLGASFGINNSGNTSAIANFQQDDYNMTFTGWYAPSARWSVSGGLGFYRNWIDQQITLGSKTNPVTQPWAFAGQSDVVNVGTTYAWTPRLTLSGSYEFIRSSNIAAAPPPYSDIPPLSSEIIEVSRFSTGLDYRWRPRVGYYFRYQFFDYEDKSQTYNSGTSDMLLFGADAIY